MKKFISTFVSSSAFAAAITFSAVSSANPMQPTVDLSFPKGGALFPEGYRATTISYSPAGTDTPDHQQRVAAGMFGGAAVGSEFFDVTTLYRSEDAVLAYCVDILNGLLRRASSYKVNSLASDQVVEQNGVRRDFGRTLRFLGAVNQVAREKYDLGFGDQNWLNPNAAWMSGAIQVGIWESLYEAKDATLGTGDGWFAATSLGVKGDRFLAKAFEAMGSSDALDARQVKWLQIENGQDLIVDPVGVPAPQPALLLLLGVLVLRMRRRDGERRA